MQCKRNREAERLGGLEVDDQLDFRRLLDRQVTRLGTLQDAAGVNAGLSKHLLEVGRVADQPAGLGVLACAVNGRQRIAVLPPEARAGGSHPGKYRKDGTCFIGYAGKEYIGGVSEIAS